MPVPSLLLLGSALAADPGAAGFGPKGFTVADASGDNTLNLGLSFQPRLTATLNGDPEAADADALSDAGLRVRRMLFTAGGTLAGRLDYRFRIDGARAFTFDDGAGKSQQATKPLLDDAQIALKVADPLRVAAGQWKVPFTLSQAMSDTTLLFPDRPLPLDGARYGDLKLSGFSWSRDAGVALLGDLAGKKVDYALGAFNGDGTNQWSPTDAAPLWVARVSVAPLGEFKLDEVDFARGGPKLAIGLGGTLERTPAFDEAGARDGQSQDLRAGADLRFAVAGLSLSGEALYGQLSPADGADPTRSLGAYAQLGYFLPAGLAPGLRWARLDPSLDAEGDGLTHLEAVLNAYLPDPAKEGATLGHKAQLQLAWTTALQDGLDHPLYHQLQLATAVGF